MDKNNNDNNTLISPDIIPITSKNRTIGMLGFANIWIGMAIVIAVFSFGASGIDGMGIAGVATATFVANLIIALIGSLTGDIGIEHGLSFATYLRAPFGLNGVHFPSVARGIVAACWFGINTYIGSTAINYFTVSLFEIDNWFLWFIIFAIVQVVNTMLGIKSIDKFASFAAPCIIIITCWMFFKINNIAALNNIVIANYKPPNPTPETWLITMCANIGMWSALAADIPNITRSIKAPVGEKNWFKRNKNNWIPQFATLPIIEMFIAVIGATSFITTGNWNPVDVIQTEAEGVTLVVLLLMVILAQWSTNTAANLVPPAMCFTNAGAKWKLSYKVAVLISGLIGVIVMPWKILDNLYTFLGYFGSFLSSIVGIMLCDYYVLRKRRLNVTDLYKIDGQYKYHNGFNLCGIIAWILSTICANFFPTYGYFVGLLISSVTYYVLMKKWYLKIFPQAEIEENFSDKYLGISANNDWIIDGYDKIEVTLNGIEDDEKTYTGGVSYKEKTGENLIITFGRQYGSQGAALAKILAKELDLPFYDEDMIKLAASNLNMNDSDLALKEETTKNELLHALTAGGMFAAKEYEASTTDKVFQTQAEIIRQLATKSSCIIVGRCSNYVLDKSKVPTFDIFVAADFDDRVKRIASRDSVSMDKAKAFVLKTERRREAYYNFYTNASWGHPDNYDLCVNTTSKNLEDISKNIAAYVNNLS